METLELGPQSSSYALRELQLLAWMEREGPSGPCAVQLGLTCTRGGRPDAAATARLHTAVYTALGPRMRSLRLHMHHHELCEVGG